MELDVAATLPGNAIFVAVKRRLILILLNGPDPEKDTPTEYTIKLNPIWQHYDSN
jgi:hypothetical protein